MSEQGAEPNAAAESVSESRAQEKAGTGRTLTRGAMALVGSQFLTAPISMVINMLMTRRLGAEEFGILYLAGTLAGLAYLFVDWGQSQSIAGATAHDPSSAPRLLGTGLTLKVIASLLAIVVLNLLARILNYGPQVQIALLLTCLQSGLIALATSYAAVLRGKERLDRLSQLTVIASLLNFGMVVPALLLGGHYVAVLIAQCSGSAVSLWLYVWRGRQLGVHPGRPDRETVRTIFKIGSGFLLLGLVMALQPALDTVILSKLSPPEVVGWYSAARRFIGLLIFPATTVSFAIFPTLVRLLRDSQERFLELAQSALRVVVIFGVPAAVGCVLYAPVVIRIFCGPNFGPSVQILQVLSLFVFFVYFSIPLGGALAALNLQTKWALAQLGCVLVSVVGDPLLIPFCQRHYGNGALGLSITCAFSEFLMVSLGIWLAPRGIVDRRMILATVRCLLSGAAMALAGIGASKLGVPWGVAAPLSLAIYAGVLALVGGIDREQTALLVAAVRRKTGALAPPAVPPGPAPAIEP